MDILFLRLVDVIDDNEQFLNAMVAILQNTGPFLSAQVLPIIPSNLYGVGF
jgi:hypothetical protein